MSDESSAFQPAVSHVMLGVHDVAASVGFYRDQLGMTLQFQSPGFAFLQAGPVTITLSAPLAQASENLIGASEIVFSVENIHEAHRELEGRGVTFDERPRAVTAKNWAANFRDPDGHKLSIFGPEPQSP